MYRRQPPLTRSSHHPSAPIDSPFNLSSLCLKTEHDFVAEHVDELDAKRSEPITISFHYEMEEYWFRVDAVFQPYGPLGQRKLPPAKHLILFRVYNNFYDLQVALIDTFPREVGQQPPNPRMLPYMPGPAQNVDDALTAMRRSELDEYANSAILIWPVPNTSWSTGLFVSFCLSNPEM